LFALVCLCACVPLHGLGLLGAARQVFRDRVPELELFSCFLRELYDTDVVLFFLHARSTIRSMQPPDVGGM
jgi:hypothetical protein